MSDKRDLYEIGQVPPVGHVPREMYAQVIRPERFGPPTQAFQVERVPVPELAPDDVLVCVMAAGINYNNVWASLGIPINVIKARERDGDLTGFHIGGSDASGVVYAVGSEVTSHQVGDEVVIHCGVWNRNDAMVKRGVDPMFAPSFRIWGYETNWGSFAQFTKVQAHQCLPKPRHLSWEAAAAYMLVGATAYRMLHGWPPNVLRAGDPVLVWGGSGGLGSMAIQIARAAGARPVAVVSKDSAFEYCKKLGAVGVINRKEFTHWGEQPHKGLDPMDPKWFQGVKAFGNKFWEVLGEKRNPTIVFEHPGEDTVPTSIFMCETGGMVVICAGTTGYKASLDLRYHWMKQKRFQGSHFANDEQAKGLNDLVLAQKVDPCLGETFTFDEIPHTHQMMYENRHPAGNMACLVGAPRPSMTTLPL